MNEILADPRVKEVAERSKRDGASSNGSSAQNGSSAGNAAQASASQNGAASNGASNVRTDNLSPRTSAFALEFFSLSNRTRSSGRRGVDEGEDISLQREYLNGGAPLFYA